MGASGSASAADDISLEEWKETRSIISRYDDNLHDLRKYGFSFVTALLAANGLLGQGSTSFTPLIKATVLIATLGLIVALRLLDKHYRMFQKAASLRARMLENRLNLDITSDIATYYDLGRWWGYVQVLYYAFISLAALVGVAILWPNGLLIFLVLWSSYASAIFVGLIDWEQPAAWADWSVDRKIVKQGDSVRITFTDLDSIDKSVKGEFEFSWTVTLDGQPAAGLVDSGKGECELNYLGDRSWLWRTPKAGVPILYCLEMKATKTGTNPEVVKKKSKRGRDAHHDVRTTIQVN